jgi:hypothetical protein
MPGVVFEPGGAWAGGAGAASSRGEARRERVECSGPLGAAAACCGGHHRGRPKRLPRPGEHPALPCGCGCQLALATVAGATRVFSGRAV